MNKAVPFSAIGELYVALVSGSTTSDYRRQLFRIRSYLLLACHSSVLLTATCISLFMAEQTPVPSTYGVSMQLEGYGLYGFSTLSCRRPALTSFPRGNLLPVGGFLLGSHSQLLSTVNGSDDDDSSLQPF